MSARFAANPYYRLYEDVLVRLHYLFAEGKGDEPEADALREDADLAARHLTSAEVGRLRGLSGDLSMLADEEVYERVSEEERLPERITREVRTAWEQEDWEGVLRELRKGPGEFSQAEIAGMRARAYRELGHQEAARLFAEHAARLAPAAVSG